MIRRRPTEPIKKKTLAEKLDLHRRIEALNPQEMASHEIRAVLEEIKASKERSVPSHKDLSDFEKVFIAKAAREIYKKDKQRAEHILASFGLPPIKTRKGLKGR